MATTPLGYPYPLGTDRVMDGDDAIHALATAVDSKLGLAASGLVSVDVTALGTPGTKTVTFPAGRFTVAPSVVANPSTPNPQQWNASVTAVTAAGFTAAAVRSAGSVPASTNVQWIALQNS